MRIFKTGKKKWINRHETFTEKIKDLYIIGNEPGLGALQAYQDTTQGLLKIVKEAVQSNTPLRTVGAAWSWTKIATVKDGIMLDTKQLNIMMSISAGAVLPSYTGDVTKLIFAQCGIAIWELNGRLKSRNRSLKTCGASNGQTIVGAMSTGAHGSTIDIGGVQDYIVGMHIIVGQNRHIYLERASQPIASDSLINNLQAELVRDDHLFNAALVSFGSFGIIHGVMLETEDLFLLETFMQRVPYEAPLKWAMDTLDFSGINPPLPAERPFHFGVSINPYDMRNGAYVNTYYKKPYRTNYSPPVKNSGGIGPGDDAPVFIGLLTDILPELVPTVVNKFIGARMTPFSSQFGVLGEIFNNTDIRGKTMSTALGIPINQVSAVTQMLLDVNRSVGPFTGIFAYRYIKSTQATLGFTRYAPFTCIVEMDGVFSKTTERFYDAVYNRLDQLGISFTFHWGKMTKLNFAKIQAKYGPNANAWIAARNQLLDASARKVFNSPLLEEWGLDA